MSLTFARNADFAVLTHIISWPYRLYNVAFNLSEWYTRKLLPIEHQAPNLNTLPLGCIFGTSLVQKRRVRRQPCNALVRVETFDQRNFIRGLVSEVIPLQPFVVLHGKRCTFAVGINVPGRNERGMRQRTVIRHTEGMMSDGISNGPPYVDDPHAAL